MTDSPKSSTIQEESFNATIKFTSIPNVEYKVSFPNLITERIIREILETKLDLYNDAIIITKFDENTYNVQLNKKYSPYPFSAFNVKWDKIKKIVPNVFREVLRGELDGEASKTIIPQIPEILREFFAHTLNTTKHFFTELDEIMTPIVEHTNQRSCDDIKVTLFYKSSNPSHVYIFPNFINILWDKVRNYTEFKLILNGAIYRTVLPVFPQILMVTHSYLFPCACNRPMCQRTLCKESQLPFPNRDNVLSCALMIVTLPEKSEITRLLCDRSGICYHGLSALLKDN